MYCICHQHIGFKIINSNTSIYTVATPNCSGFPWTTGACMDRSPSDLISLSECVELIL